MRELRRSWAAKSPKALFKFERRTRLRIGSSNFMTPDVRQELAELRARVAELMAELATEQAHAAVVPADLLAQGADVMTLSLPLSSRHCPRPVLIKRKVPLTWENTSCSGTCSTRSKEHLSGDADYPVLSASSG